jgi:ABC-type Mn2+/Zn2+ transport system ATPase subunit
MTYNQFDKENNVDTRIHIPPPNPKDTLFKQGISVIKSLPVWKQCAMLFFAIGMVLFPIGINWMNIQMIQGVSNGFAKVFVGVKLSEWVINVLRELFLIRIGINAQVMFVIDEVARYALLSKPTSYRHPAETVLAKDLINAASAINRLIEWGMQSLTSTFGQIISSFVLLMSMDLKWYDSIAFVMFALVFWRGLMPLQKSLTERMEIHRKKNDRCNNLISFLSTELKNKECDPNEYSGILNDPIEYDGQVRPLFTYTFGLIDITMIVIMGVYAWLLPNDNLFAVKYVLVNSISTSINSIAGFGTQYHRYCNDYEKYYKLFRDPDLKYDEYVAPQDCPNEIVLESVHLNRGNYVISCDESFRIKQGDNLIIQGPSGIGKSTFFDAFMGYISGIILRNGVNIRAYAHQMVYHLQNVQSFSLNSVSIFDVFRSNDPIHIRYFLDLFFEKPDLDKVLDNISKENPFGTHMEDKMSGGEKTRFFLAVTLEKAIRKKAKIVFFDEPEQGQDPPLQINSFRAINEFARQRGLTIFWITHLRPEPLNETGIQFSGRLQFERENDGAKIMFSQ